MRNRIRTPGARTVLMLVALIPLVVPLLACGAMGDSLTEAAFTTTCTNECAVTVDRGLCETYCACGYRYARDNDRLEELNGVTAVPGQPMPPVLLDLMAECGSEVYDTNFTSTCVRECSNNADPGVCQTRCECFLRELRGTAPVSESTRFLIENLDVTPPTPAGQERFDAALAVCAPSE